MSNLSLELGRSCGGSQRCWLIPSIIVTLEKIPRQLLPPPAHVGSE